MTKRNGLFCAILLSSWSGIASAHDTWIIADQLHIEPKTKAPLFLCTGEDFPKSENAIKPERLEAFFVFGVDGKKVPLQTTRVEREALASDFLFEEPGNYWVAAGTKPKLIEMKAEKFNSYLEHDGMPEILKARKVKGLLGRDEVEQYSKFPKTLIRVGSPANSKTTELLGLKIEIVPTKDPFAYRIGEEFPVTVLLDGKPLKGFTLQAVLNRTAGALAEAKTDEKGHATLKLPKPGQWMLRGIHMSEVDGKEYRYESFWASLTFEVQ